MGKFYDGTRLLSMKDINGNEPEIYICSSNRSAGKTTFFNRWCVKKFIENKEQFILLYRYNYELSDIAHKFFDEIKALFYPHYTMTSKSCAKGVYHELFLNNTTCGYAVSINNADQLKKMSHIFSKCVRILFDEFQSESGHYCSNEVQKFISLHTSIARGGGKQVRRVPVYMLGNFVSLLNPYYVELGISQRLRIDTNFLRGNGYVLEQGFYTSASDAQKKSAFNIAFEKNSYVSFASEKCYLNDNNAFIERPSGRSTYVCTVKYESGLYAIRLYPDKGIVYCDNSVDETFPRKIVVTTADHEINYVMLKQNDVFISMLRWYFEKGCFRFKDLKCKNTILNLCAYR